MSPSSTLPNKNKPTVVTGQQLGLLGGPLFSLYKLLGAIHAATQHNLKAIYWLETHDADFSEANTLTFLTAKKTYHRLSWRKKTLGKPLGTVLIDNELATLIAQAFTKLPASPHHAYWKKLVKDIFKEKRSLGAATEDLFKEAFADFPITFFNPYQRAFHDFAKPILLKEALATKIGAACNLFALVEGVRVRVFRTSQHTFTARNGTPLKLAKHILLPNLQTRSVLQDAYLNATYYIAGPSEALYLKTLAPTYHYHQVTPARIQKRMSATLLTPHDRALIEKYNLSVAALEKSSYTSLCYHHIQEKTGIDIIAKRKSTFALKADILRRIHQHFALSPHQLSTTMHSRRIERVLYQELKHLLGKERRQLKTSLRDAQADLLYLTNWVHPLATKQERSYNWLPLLSYYGKALLSKLYNAHSFTEKIITLPNQPL